VNISGGFEIVVALLREERRCRRLILESKML
jgi:hypothetical protein